MAEWETSQLSSSSSDTESQEERDVHTPRTPIQNVNLSYSSTSSNASPVQTPKTKEINRLREENRRLKEQALSLQPDRHSEHDDDDVQDADGRYKDWSQLGTFQKRKIVCDIETKLKWAKKGFSQKMTKQIKLRYWYDFEMFTKWNHTTILKI